MKGEPVAVNYPCPELWLRPRYVRISCTVTAIFLFGLFLIYYGLGGISVGQWVRVAFGVVGGLGVIGFSTYVLVATTPGGLSGFQGSLPAVAGDGGLRLTWPRTWGVVDALTYLAFAVSGMLFSVGVWCDLFQPDLTPGQRSFFPLVVLLIAAGSCHSVYFKIARMSRGVVVLTPSEMVVADHNRVRSVDWVEIRRVTPVGGRERKRMRSTIELERHKGRPLEIRVDELEVGAPAAFWLIDFYWRNPDARWELSTGRPVERLRDGSIVEEADRFVSFES